MTTARERELERLARRITWTVVANALAALTLGLMLLAWPAPTLTVAATVIGIWLLLEGVTRVLDAVREWDRDRVAHGIRGFSGLLLTVAGVVTMRHPGGSLRVVAGAVGVGLVLGGAVELIMALAERPARWWAHTAAGSAALLAGLAMLVWPRPTVAVLTFAAGSALTAVGAVRLVLIRRAGEELRRLTG